ncbi:WD repeat-containing protein 20 isoform X3 [Dermatophagoides farinae]|uniref:WD repeat-containing protein 20 isoform X3 n=1 Tax=Dermatophagoides farinae TaxID=6954 RepID=UPI003F632DEA
MHQSSSSVIMMNLQQQQQHQSQSQQQQQQQHNTNHQNGHITPTNENDDDDNINNDDDGGGATLDTVDNQMQIDVHHHHSNITRIYDRHAHHHHHPSHHHYSYNIPIQERICFNSGRELFVYGFHGLQPSNPAGLIDRKQYKATSPTCHDFSTNIEPPISLLLIGFSLGQIQLVDFYRTEISKFYNQERLIDKSKVTCIRWLPRSKSNFIVSYSSGQMYVYKEDLPCFTTQPNYQQYKCGDGFVIYTCKTRQPRNPIFRWSIGASINNNNSNNSSNAWNSGNILSHQSSINEFSFSPCGKYLAIVSQDGFLRCFHYDQMDLIGCMRSYFGGLLCVDWSPDSKFIVTGGEDDLITVWSLQDKRVIARGQGHKSWVNCVRFDPYMTTDMKNSNFDNDDDDGNDEDCDNGDQKQFSDTTNEFRLLTNYRIGSVGQDTQICLWDLTDDIIRQSTVIKSRSRSTISQHSSGVVGHHHHHHHSLSKTTPAPTAINSTTNHTTITTANDSTTINNNRSSLKLFSTSTNSNSNNQSNHHHHHHHNFFNSLKKGVHKKSSVVGFSLGSSSSKSILKSDQKNNHHNQLENNIMTTTTTTTSSTSSSLSMNLNNEHSTPLSSSISHHHHNNVAAVIESNCDPSRLLGTIVCPRLKEVPMLEPHVCKKISNERLTSLIFRKESIVVANHDGKILLFARPTKSNNTNLKISSPNASMASDVNEIPIVPGDLNE